MSIRFEYTKRLPDSFWGHVSTVALINESLGQQRAAGEDVTPLSMPDEYIEQILRRMIREAIAEALLVELPGTEQNVPALMHAALRARLTGVVKESGQIGLLNEGLVTLNEATTLNALSDLFRTELSEGEKALAWRLMGNTSAVNQTGSYRLLLELAAQVSKLWPKDQHVLTVYFFSGTDQYHAKLLDIANEWNKYCGIRFEKSNDRINAHLRVAFKPDFSSSYVGKDAQDPSISKALETINFGWLTPELDTDEDRHLILHEFGHALGLVHEHAREDANIEWDRDEVKKAFAKYSDEWLEVNVYQEFKRHETNHSGVVDPDSIMAYDIAPQLTRARRVFKRNTALSAIDKQHIGVIYPMRPDQLRS